VTGDRATFMMRGVRSLVAVFTVVVVLGGALAACGTSTPPVIREELARAPRGVVTVVFFTDFQCPFCRRTHAALAPLLRQYEGRVRVVLRHVPLSMHPDARSAARAAVCGEASGARDELVHALFDAPDLGEAATETIAVDAGAAREAYRRCVADPATDARIDADSKMLDAVSGDGVPLLYVGRTRLDGAQSTVALDAAIREALADVTRKK